MECGAKAYGFRGHIWTCKRMAEFIRCTFSITYHPAHISRLLHAVRQSVHRPHPRAAQRNEAAIQAWWHKRWPALGKKAVDEARTVVWVDQSGFYLLSHVVRTWAPCGQSPVLRVPLTHDHLAVISGITVDGRLFMQTQEHAYGSPDVVRFLRLLLRTIRGKRLVIWESSPIHRGEPVKDFLCQGAAKRLHLEQVPAYAPELNPDEGIWNYLKCVELGNRCCHDLSELALALRRAKERLRHQRSIIQACVRQAGYRVWPVDEQAHVRRCDASRRESVRDS